MLEKESIHMKKSTIWAQTTNLSKMTQFAPSATISLNAGPTPIFTSNFIWMERTYADEWWCWKELRWICLCLPVLYMIQKAIAQTQIFFCAETQLEMNSLKSWENMWARLSTNFRTDHSLIYDDLRRTRTTKTADSLGAWVTIENNLYTSD